MASAIDVLKRQATSEHHHKNRTPKALERIILNYSLINPHLGQAQVALHVRKNYNIEISPNGVRSIWLRENMNTAALRVARTNQQEKFD